MFSNQEKQGQIVHRSGIIGRKKTTNEKKKNIFFIQEMMVKGIKTI